MESYSALHRTRVRPPRVVFAAKNATPIGEERSCACITALLSPPTAHRHALIFPNGRGVGDGGASWVCLVYQLQRSPSRCLGVSENSLNYLPSIKVKGFCSRQRNNCSNLPFSYHPVTSLASLTMGMDYVAAHL